MKSRSPLQRLRLPLTLSVIWCLLMLVLYQRGSMDKDARTHDLALAQARALYMQILDVRAWNAAHGGVYVPESAYGGPNPWLPPEQRVLKLPDGTRLVLMNPAYMSRQIAERSAMRGTSFRIVSHAPLRPENISDQWETRALEECANGAPEIFAAEKRDDGGQFRYLAALRAEKNCLSCHDEILEGDVRGGISIKLDAAPFLEADRTKAQRLFLAFGLMSFTGVGGITGVSLLVRRRRALSEEKERLKTAFLSNMSHDMRTPLAGILGMTELLKEESSPERRQEALRYLSAAGGALLEMVDDITDYAALDTGNIRLERRSFDLRTTLESCLALFRPQCAAKRLELVLTVESGVPERFCGDAFRLRQVLGNLISNGVKFTEKGGLRVDVRRAEEDEHGEEQETRLLFSVSDTGMGIPPEEQQRIFRRFERGADARRKDLSGTGLGLSIAQDIVQLMGGRLEARSRPGEGACFFFTVSLEVAPPDAPPRAQGDAPPKNFSGVAGLLPAGARVLLAEDNRITAHFVERVLCKAGCVVRVAGDGESALRMLRKEPADVVLLDVRMPGMDGLTAAARLRAEEKAAHMSPVPLLMLSASASPQDRRACRELGAVSLLLKPVAARRLLEAVAGALGAAAARPAGAKEDTMAVFDARGAREALDGDEALLGRLCALWLEEAPRQWAALVRAAAAADAAEVRRVAHAWKNSAGTLHLGQVRGACAALEKADALHWPRLLKRLEKADARSRAALERFINHSASL